jgi:hypothetical protein
MPRSDARTPDEYVASLIGETIAKSDLASFLEHHEEARGSSWATRNGS